MEKRISLINSGSLYLNQAGLTNALRESEIFLAHVLHCTRSELYLDDLAVEEKYCRSYWGLLASRSSAQPLQYLIGSVEFMGWEFKVAPEVFIPRPETEILVETVIELLPFTLSPNILDLGTGCGNIAISLARYFKKADIFACDIADSALKLSQENACLNGVDLCLVKSNLFSAFKNKDFFSLIVSNPPYIPSRQILKLGRELFYEPRLALDGGADGLDYYRKIIPQAPDYLQNEGLLVLEIGDEQSALVKEIFAQSSQFLLLKVVKDYNDLERVIVAQKIQ